MATTVTEFRAKWARLKKMADPKQTHLGAHDRDAVAFALRRNELQEDALHALADFLNAQDDEEGSPIPLDVLRETLIEMLDAVERHGTGKSILRPQKRKRAS